MLHFCLTGLEEVKDFLEQSFPNVEIAVAHGQVFFLSEKCYMFNRKLSLCGYTIVAQTTQRSTFKCVLPYQGLI
jgi:transcription-repair coupling factor (superfamily II helicase)